jgi:hypothetical protein
MPLSIMAAAIGLWFTPVLFVLVLCIVLAFHRQGVVLGQPWYVKLGAYVLIIAGATSMVYGTKVLIVRNAPHLPTSEEMFAIVQRALSKQPTIVLPPPTPPAIVQSPPEQPFISIGPTSAEHDPAKQKTTFHLSYENTGGAPTNFTITFSVTLDGHPMDAITSDMPRGAVLIPAHGNSTLHIYLKNPTDEIDKAIWEGNSKLDISTELKYANTIYKFVGRLDPRSNIISTLVSESSKIRR